MVYCYLRRREREGVWIRVHRALLFEDRELVGRDASLGAVIQNRNDAKGVLKLSRQAIFFVSAHLPVTRVADTITAIATLVRR